MLSQKASSLTKMFFNVFVWFLFFKSLCSGHKQRTEWLVQIKKSTEILGNWFAQILVLIELVNVQMQF